MRGEPTENERRATSASAILRVLSQLTPDNRTQQVDVSGSGPTAMAWLGTFPTVTSGDPTGEFEGMGGVLTVGRHPGLQGLARHDALTPDVDDLRLGWLWIVGEARIDGEVRRLVIPLLSRPCQVAASVTGMSVTSLGPWDLWPLVDDFSVARDLERTAAFGGGSLDHDPSQALIDRLRLLRQWVDQGVAAAGLPPVSRLLAPTDVTALDVPGGLVAVVGFGVFVEEVVDVTHPHQTLQAWSVDPRAAETAFTSLYLGAAPKGGRLDPDAGRSGGEEPAPGLPLDARQTEVVLRARHEAITVVSGPPGTGKSQTAAAVALDAIERGERVLVATRSAVAAEVLANLLHRLPGPEPVLFGGSVLARKLAAQLADGLAAPAGTKAAARSIEAIATYAELRSAVEAELSGVADTSEWDERSVALAHHALVAPLLLEPGARASSAEAADLMARIRQPRGLFAGWRRRRAETALQRLVGAPSGASVEEVGRAVELAALRDRARVAARRDPARSRRTWAALVRADQERRRAGAAALAEAVAQRVEGDSHRAVAALATALRSGRAVRRAHLARVDMASLTTALPLWVGTLGQIESLLPAVAGAFDLVILDEASQIDQVSASAALLRADRAVVIGDPRQLRFVSFVADADVATAVAAHGCGALADRLDIRRVSAFDLAAGAAPVTFLEEHYRSAPHLIGFSARRFYEDRLLVATRHPTNHRRAAIEVLHLEGARVAGVNQVEVEVAVARAAELLAADATTTVGLVSPYRAQVDAIVRSLSDVLSLEVLQSGRVRAGTVHEFQGAECDIVIASFGIGGEADRGRHFLEDPNLFNVLVTRARDRLVVLLSGDPPTTGLLAEYLAWAETLPPLPPQGRPADEWTGRLAAVVRDAGSTVHVGYPVGRWTLDLVVGSGASALAVSTRVHPDGPAAHVARHLALARAGWHQADAFAGDNEGDVVATALGLVAQVDGAAAGLDR